MKEIYLDNAATTAPDPEVIDAMLPWLKAGYGNASSVHSAGRQAKVMIEDSRDMFAEFIGARSSEIYFTSGGTEADNFAVKGIAFSRLGSMPDSGLRPHIISSAIEHSAVLDTLEYLKHRFAVEVTYLSPGRFGHIDPDEVEKAIRPETILLTIMHSNNELGVINSTLPLARAARSRNIPFFTDAVQSLGKTEVNVGKMECDAASFSGHKIYGPKGIGALFIKKDTAIDKFIHGGKQERDRRGGTENTAAIAGFAKAIELLKSRKKTDIELYSALREHFVKSMRNVFGSSVIFNSPGCAESPGNLEYLPNIVSISFDPASIKADADTLLIKLDMKKIAVSSGSACTSGSVQPSHVLKALGYDDSTARSSLRVSFGRTNTIGDIDTLVDALKDIIT